MELTINLTARIIYTFYRHSREMRGRLDSSTTELDQSQFFRMFTLGCFDSIITLPTSVTSLVGNIVLTSPQLDFYQGWTFIHSDWEPSLVPKSMWSMDKWEAFSVYWDAWINPFFALVFFALFGLTPGARKGYRRFFHFVGKPLGVRPAEEVKDSLPEMFGEGGAVNITDTSNISSRCSLSILSARKELFIILANSSTPADVSDWLIIKDRPNTSRTEIRHGDRATVHVFIWIMT